MALPGSLGRLCRKASAGRHPSLSSLSGASAPSARHRVAQRLLSPAPRAFAASSGGGPADRSGSGKIGPDVGNTIKDAAAAGHAGARPDTASKRAAGAAHEGAAERSQDGVEVDGSKANESGSSSSSADQAASDGGSSSAGPASASASAGSASGSGSSSGSAYSSQYTAGGSTRGASSRQQFPNANARSKQYPPTTFARMLLDGMQASRAASAMLARGPLGHTAKATATALDRSVESALRTDVVRDAVGTAGQRNLRKGYADGKKVLETFSSSLSHETLQTGLQGVADQSNELFKALEMDMKVLGPEDPNWAQVRVVEDLVFSGSTKSSEAEAAGLDGAGEGLGAGSAGSAGGVGSAGGAALSSSASSSSAPGQDSQMTIFNRDKARDFVHLMKRARRDRGGNALIDRYISAMLEDDNFKRIQHLPMALERKLYFDIIRTVLQVFEMTMQSLDGLDVLGHEVRVDLNILDAMEVAVEATAVKARWTPLNEARVEKVIGMLMEEHEDLRRYGFFMPTIEKQFTTAVSQIIMRLANDLFCDQRLQIHVMGHRVSWSCEPLSLDEIERCFQHRAPKGSSSSTSVPPRGGVSYGAQHAPHRMKVNKDAIRLFVDELLADEEMNLFLVPDILEAEIYEHALTTILVILEDVFLNVEVNLLGSSFRLSLVNSMEAASFAAKDHGPSASGSRSGEERQGGNTSSEKKKKKVFDKNVAGKTSSTAASGKTRFPAEDTSPIFYVSAPALRARLNAVMQEADVLERMLAEKGADVPFRGASAGSSVSPSAGAGSAAGAATNSAMPNSGRGGSSVPGFGDGSAPRGRTSSAMRPPFFPPFPVNPLEGLGASAMRGQQFGRRSDGASHSSSPPASARGSSADGASSFSEGGGGGGGMSLFDSIDVSTDVFPEMRSQFVDTRERHEFQLLAAKDSLSRALVLRADAPGMNIAVPFSMLADVEAYRFWMPMCTGGKMLEPGFPDGFLGGAAGGAKGGAAGAEVSPIQVQVACGFGIDTKTFLGVLGDDVRYTMHVTRPRPVGPGLLQARVVADTGPAGFAYGDRLVYDWVFTMKEEDAGAGGNGGEDALPPSTEVSLNLFFQAKSVVYLPIWDAMNQVISETMMEAFLRRAGTVEVPPLRVGDFSPSSEEDLRKP